MAHPADGHDTDIRDAYVLSQIKTRRGRARDLLERARDLASGDRVHSEVVARQALSFFAGALDWAEDTAEEEAAHREMDEAGKWTRRTFGCHLERRGFEYFQSCQVALAHNRIGMSIGGTATRTCSLCGDDLSECDHMPGTAYLVPGGPSELGWCRVCLKESCDHKQNETYRVSVVARITEMHIDEVSVVGKPAHPEARFTSVSLSVHDLAGVLGEAFAPGVDVNCDRCLSRCEGLTRHEMLHG
jgi:hypothetical protein